jgi:glucoamylase
MQQFAVGIGLIPEQVWDKSPIRDKLLIPGGPTGSAIPLAWAHAEYIKLVRSIADGRVFDLIGPVHARYAKESRRDHAPLEVWSQKRPVRSIPRGSPLRVMAGAPFTLHWTSNDWHDERDAAGFATKLGVWFVDVPPPSSTRLRFRLAFAGNQTEVGDTTVDIV